MTSLVHYDIRDQVATITLDSPQNRNALSRALTGELTGRLAAAGQDRAVRVVVLTHTGRVLCSGAGPVRGQAADRWRTPPRRW